MSTKEFDIDRLAELMGGGISGKIISTVIILVIGMLLLKVGMVILRRALNRTSMDKVLHTFVEKTVKVICLVILFITVMSNLGVPTSSFVTVIASCGVAIALALKDSLSNFAGGMLILLTKPFKQGDLINTNGVDGRVQQIDLLYTTLLSLNYRTITIPNGMVSNNTIINYSASDTRRIDIKCGISYSEDIEKVRSVVLEVIEGCELFKRVPEPFVGVAEHGDSSVILDVQVWCDTDNFFKGRYYLRENIKKAFDRENIEIPYQQITIHGDIGDFQNK